MQSSKGNRDRLLLQKDETAAHAPGAGRTVYVHVVSGSITIDGEVLTGGDGATIRDVEHIEFAGHEASEALVFDLP